MAVKYKRDPDSKFDWNVRGRSTEQIRRKTLLIYAGLSVALIAAVVFHYMGQGNFGNWHGPFNTVAVVTEKVTQFEGEPHARFFLRCEVETASLHFEGVTEAAAIPAKMESLVRVDDAGWQVIEVGDVIHVTCSITPDLSSLRIQRIGLDTLIEQRTSGAAPPDDEPIGAPEN